MSENPFGRDVLKRILPQAAVVPFSLLAKRVRAEGIFRTHATPCDEHPGKITS